MLPCGVSRSLDRVMHDNGGNSRAAGAAENLLLRVSAPPRENNLSLRAFAASREQDHAATCA